MNDKRLIDLTENDFFIKIEQIIEAKIASVVPVKKEETEYLTRKEVCKILRITMPTLYAWVKQGYLKPLRIGFRVLFRKAELEVAFEKQAKNNALSKVKDTSWQKLYE
jgi:excisionase family DNA binding protein